MEQRPDLHLSGRSVSAAPFPKRLRALSDLQDLAQMFDADAQLLQPCQIVEHAPLLGNAVSSNPVNRHFLYLDTPPRRLDAPEHTLVRSSGNVAAGDPVTGAENIHHLCIPVVERGADL